MEVRKEWGEKVDGSRESEVREKQKKVQGKEHQYRESGDTCSDISNLFRPPCQHKSSHGPSIHPTLFETDANEMNYQTTTK